MVGILTALFTRALANERDVAESEAQRLSTDLAHLSRVTMMGELAAGMAHEYHQPLAAITNYASATLNILRSHALAYQAARKPLECITEEAVRAAEIVDRLKDFLQKREIERVPCDAGKIIAEAIHLTRMSHAFRSIAVRYQAVPGLPLVMIDPVQITQILVNLLVNAFEALQSSNNGTGEVRITTAAATQDRIRISIEDDGPGMDEDTARACFEQFYTTKEHGLGIGLGISRTLAVANGGTLTYEPTKGRGARFCLELPIAS